MLVTDGIEAVLILFTLTLFLKEVVELGDAVISREMQFLKLG